jgi:hypothetical protein
MALTRLQQLCIAAESVEGTAVAAATLFSASNAKYLAIDPSMTFEVETYQRDVARESFTPLSPLAGAVLGSCSFSLEMSAKSASPITISNAPQWDLPLTACGFRRERLIRLTLSAGVTTNAIAHGTLLTATGTATAIGNYPIGSTTVWCSKGSENTLGNSTPMGTVSLTSSSGSVAHGTVTASSANAAIGWFPSSVALYKATVASLSAALNANDVVVGNSSGAIGIVYYAAASTATVVYMRRVQGTFTTSDTACVVYRAGSVVSGLNPSFSGGSYTQAFDATASVYNIAPAVSIGLSKDGVRESIKGARGSVSISGNVGEPVLLNFNFQGIKEAVVDGGSVASVTYDDATPPVLLGATMTVGDSNFTAAQRKSFCATSFSFDMANDIQYRRCLTAATGIDGIYYNGRTPTGTINPDLSLELDYDWMDNYFSATTLGIDTTVGTTAPNKFRVNVLNAAVTAVGQGDRNGIITRDITFNMSSGSSSSVAGDNEFVVIWDPTT